MCKGDDPPPAETVWTVQITNGVHATEGGQLGGWGWICLCHAGPEGMHGYLEPREALGALLVHIERCAGRG